MAGRPSKSDRAKAQKTKKRGRSARDAQGAELPPDGSPISAYPDRCCVELEVDGEVAWHMILFRIGRSGPPFCGRMSHPPSSADWNSRMGGARAVPDAAGVRRSAWPLRASTADSDGAEVDPLVGQKVEGSLMLSHLRDADPPQPSGAGP